MKIHQFSYPLNIAEKPNFELLFRVTCGPVAQITPISCCLINSRFPGYS